MSMGELIFTSAVTYLMIQTVSRIIGATRGN